MAMPVDEQALARQLQVLGCAVGQSKSGRLLRVDNRQCPAPLGPAVLEQIVECSALREVWLQGVTGFLNSHIDKITALRRLRSLDVEDSDLTDDSLQKLAQCPDLRVLNVRNTSVSETCVAELRKSMIGTRIIF